MFSYPLWLLILFHAAFLGIGLVFLRAAGPSNKRVVQVLSFWMLSQAGLGFNEFYLQTEGFPPRMLLLVAPPIAMLIGLLLSAQGRHFLRQLDTRLLLAMHIFRIPVELALHALADMGAVPKMLTWEGTNFDLFSGLFAAGILALYRKKPLPRALLWTFNVLGIALLLNVVIPGVLSVPGPLQQFNFDQPNRAMLEYPFLLLPALIVPLVMLSHAAMLVQLLDRQQLKK
jgi:hypothetical protein